MLDLAFRLVDADADRETCRRFATEAYLASFGSADRMEPSGFDWNSWFRAKVAAFPEGWLFACRGTAVVGHIAFEVDPTSRLGSVHLLYVLPEARGTTVSAALHRHALAVFRKHGVHRAALNVSPTNQRAVAFYRKHGWIDAGTHPGDDYVHVMHLAIP